MSWVLFGAVWCAEGQPRDLIIWSPHSWVGQAVVAVGWVCPQELSLAQGSWGCLDGGVSSGPSRLSFLAWWAIPSQPGAFCARQDLPGWPRGITVWVAA